MFDCMPNHVVDGCHSKSSLTADCRFVTCPWSALCHMCMSSPFVLQCRLHCTCWFGAEQSPILFVCSTTNFLNAYPKAQVVYCSVGLLLAHAVVPVVYLRGCQTIVVLCDAFLSLISMGWWFAVHCLWLIHIMHCPGMDWWCQGGVLWGQGKGDIAGQTM